MVGMLVQKRRALLENHGVPVEIGESNEPIPIHFAYRRDINIEAPLSTNDGKPFQFPPMMGRKVTSAS